MEHACVFARSGGDHPALLGLDDRHLLLFFTTGGDVSDSSSASGRRLRIALLDVTTTGTIEASEFVPSTQPYASDTRLRQRRPAATRVGNRIFLAWENESPLGDPLQDQFWVSEIEWSPTDPKAIRRLGEWPAPVDAFRLGHQKSPALAASPLFPDGALISVWEDHSGLLAGRPSPDLMLNFRPVPFVTLADGGG